MSDIVSLPEKKMQVWTCRCGCYSFELREDGKAICNACHAEPTDEGALGWWRPKRAGDPQIDENTHPDVRPTSSALSNIENYSRHRMLQTLRTDQTVTWVAYGRDDGSVQTWKMHPPEDGSPEELRRDRNRWILRRLKDAARLLLDQSLQRRKPKPENQEG